VQCPVACSDGKNREILARILLHVAEDVVDSPYQEQEVELSGSACGWRVFLVGTYELVIDAKNRLSIPFSVRRKLDPERDGHSFYVSPAQRRGTLALYPEKYFERLRPALPEETLSEHTQQWRQFELSQTALLDADSQGRILIPERLLKRAGLGKEVVLTGAHDHLVLWNRHEFEEFENRQWEQFPENRSKAMQELRTLAAARSSAESTA